MEEIKKSQVDLVYSVMGGLNCSGFIRELSKRNKYDVMIVFGVSDIDLKKEVNIDDNNLKLKYLPHNFDLVNKILIFSEDFLKEEMNKEIDMIKNLYGKDIKNRVEFYRSSPNNSQKYRENSNGYKQIWSSLMKDENILIEDRYGDSDIDFINSFHITSNVKEKLKIPHYVIFDNIYKVVNNENLVINYGNNEEVSNMEIFVEEIFINSVDNIVVVDCEEIEDGVKNQKFQSPEELARFAKLSEFLGSLGRVQGEYNLGLPSIMKFYFQTGNSDECVSGPFEWGQLRMANVKVGNGPKPYEFPKGYEIPEIKIADELDDIS